MNVADAPPWLLRAEPSLCPCGCIGKRRKGSYLSKTLNTSADLLRQMMFSDELPTRPGLLHRIDPRVKILALITLLVGAAFLRTIPALIALYGLTLALASASGLSLRYFVRRVLLFVPVFTGVVLLPATLSIVTPGDVIWTLWHWRGHPHGITWQGVHSAALVMCRVTTSISLVMLVTLTTQWTRLLAALRALAVPRTFVLIIGMAYRYLFLLLGSVTDMYQARTARTVGVVKHDRSGRRFVVAGAGALLAKSLTMSEEVHQAMVSRGYRGEARTLIPPAITARDAVFAMAAVSLAVGLLIGEHVLR